MLNVYHALLINCVHDACYQRQPLWSPGYHNTARALTRWDAGDQIDNHCKVSTDIIRPKQKWAMLKQDVPSSVGPTLT